MIDYYSIDTDSFRYISHHGILGQKWGIRRYQNEDGTLTEAGKVKKAKLLEKNKKYAVKEANYNIKSDKARIKSEKFHAADVNELTRKRAARSAKMALKADKYHKRALVTEDVDKELKYERKEALYNYRKAKYDRNINRLSKSVGYYGKAMKLSIKSDVFKTKAAKYELKIKNNELYINKYLKTKISSLDAQVMEEHK